MRFETMLTVDAPPEVVWEVLTDVESWPQITESHDLGEAGRGGSASTRVAREGQAAEVLRPRGRSPNSSTTSCSASRGCRAALGVRSTGVHEVTTRNGTTHLRLELDQTGVLAGVVGLSAAG